MRLTRLAPRSSETLPWTGSKPCVVAKQKPEKHTKDCGSRISGRNGFFYMDEQLNGRQKDIVRLLGQGVKQVDIARELGLSVDTVKYNVTAAIDKLKLWDTKSLITWARLYPEYLL